ncbi:MAG: hypothetical protein LBI53_02340 [Candidatus Peribacteria bacterium]|jgi:hypothetical protein|nr:hypothetical protein [Candidatus Peribacteria bacterium]
MENYEVQEQGNEEDTQELHPYIAEYMANVEQLGNNEMASSHDNRHLLSYSELRVFKNEKGEIIYEREFPLSNEYYTLTEEAFENEILHINKNLQTKKKEAEEQRDLHDKLINTGCKNI